MENDILKLGSIWIGQKPKDGAILTPHANIPFLNEKETDDRFRYDAKTDSLIQIEKPKPDGSK